MSVICVSFHINNPYIGDNIGLSMKILLTLIMCSSVESICLPPHPWPQLFNDKYDCLQFGYQESYKKLEAIGRKDVNEHGIYIKFDCQPSNII